MKRVLGFLVGLAILGGALAIHITVIQMPHAQEEEEEKIDYSKLKAKRTPTLGPKVFQQLSEVSKLLEEEKNNVDKAQAILDRVLRDDERGRLPLNNYELANVLNTYAYTYYLQEDYNNALKTYRRVIESPEDIPYSLFLNTKYIIAQLYFVLENYKRAIRELKQWINLAENPAPDVYFVLAQAYFQDEQKALALKTAEDALALAEQREAEMRESWYLLLRALYFENEEYDKALGVLRQLVSKWPKKEYWVQLGSLYGQKEDQEKHRGALSLAHLQRILNKEKEVVALAYLLLAVETPYEAGKVLAWGIENELVEETSKNLELLGSAWQSAQETEKALPILEKAAEMSEKGEIYARLASVYLNLYRYEDAVRTAEEAKEKGEVKRPDLLQMTLGMSLFNLGNYEDATVAFEEAGEDERSENLADQWQVFIIKEKKRLKHLERETQRLENYKFDIRQEI